MTDTTTHLSEQQLARVEALKAAQPLVRTSSGPFGSTTPPELNDLVDLALFILEGKHPMTDHYERMTLDGQSVMGIKTEKEKPDVDPDA